MPARPPAPPRCGAAVPGRARPRPRPARRARPPRPRGGSARGRTWSGTARSWAATRSRLAALAGARSRRTVARRVRVRSGGHDAQRPASACGSCGCRCGSCTPKTSRWHDRRNGRRPDSAVRVRRTRARRVVAFAGMLTTVAGLVGVRAAMTPAPHQALGSSGLAAEAGTSGSTPATAAPRPARQAAGRWLGAGQARRRGQGLRRQLRHRPGQGDLHRDPDHRHHADVAARGRSLRRHQPVRRSPAASRGAQRPRARTSTACRVRRTPRPATPCRCSRRSTRADDEAGRAGPTMGTVVSRSTYARPPVPTAFGEAVEAVTRRLQAIDEQFSAVAPGLLGQPADQRRRRAGRTARPRCSGWSRSRWT